MAKNNSSNQDFTNNADGFDLSGGTTPRKMTLISGNVTLTGGGSNVHTFPSSTDTLVGRASIDTLTGKRITARSLVSSNDTTFDIDTDLYDYAEDTGLTGAVTVTASGTPTVGQKLWVSLTGTAARGITWDSGDFESGPVTLPTTTVTTQRLDTFFIWNTASSKYRCMASGSA